MKNFNFWTGIMITLLQKENNIQVGRWTLRTWPHPCLYRLHFIRTCFLLSLASYLYFQCLCKHKQCIFRVYRNDRMVFLLRSISILMFCLCILKISCTWSWSIVLLVWCCILIASIFFRIYAPIFMCEFHWPFLLCTALVINVILAG